MLSKSKLSKNKLPKDNLSKSKLSKILKFLKFHLFLQVMIAVILGILVGVFAPHFAIELKIIATLFIRFIKMVISPVVCVLNIFFLF